MPAYEVYILFGPLYRRPKRPTVRYWVLVTDDWPTPDVPSQDEIVAGFWAEDLLRARRVLAAFMKDAKPSRRR